MLLVYCPVFCTLRLFDEVTCLIPGLSVLNMIFFYRVVMVILSELRSTTDYTGRTTLLVCCLL